MPSQQLAPTLNHLFYTDACGVLMAVEHNLFFPFLPRSVSKLAASTQALITPSSPELPELPEQPLSSHWALPEQKPHHNFLSSFDGYPREPNQSQVLVCKSRLRSLAHRGYSFLMSGRANDKSIITGCYLEDIFVNLRGATAISQLLNEDHDHNPKLPTISNQVSSGIHNNTGSVIFLENKPSSHLPPARLSSFVASNTLQWHPAAYLLHK